MPAKGSIEPVAPTERNLLRLVTSTGTSIVRAPDAPLSPTTLIICQIPLTRLTLTMAAGSCELARLFAGTLIPRLARRTAPLFALTNLSYCIALALGNDGAEQTTRATLHTAHLATSMATG